MALSRNIYWRKTLLNLLIVVLTMAPLGHVLAQAKRDRSVSEKAPTPAQKVPPSTENKSAVPAQSQDPKSKPVVKEPKEEDAGPILKIESKLVAVPVSVTDVKGEPIRGLRPEDFRLEEEGQLQQLVALGDPGQTPVELSLLFDVSGSVFERFKFQQEAAARFLKQVLKPKDAASVFIIGMDAKMAQGRTTSIDQALKGLSRDCAEST